MPRLCVVQRLFFTASEMEYRMFPAAFLPAERPQPDKFKKNKKIFKKPLTFQKKRGIIYESLRDKAKR